MIALSTSGPDTPLPFGHFEAPCSGGGSAAAAAGGDVVKKNLKRGAFSRRRQTVLLPEIPLSLVKKIKVRVCALRGRFLVYTLESRTTGTFFFSFFL